MKEKDHMYSLATLHVNMEKKQTAVDWLIDNLKPLYPEIQEFKLIIGLAKDKEKEQIIEAHEQGCDDFLQ